MAGMYSMPGLTGFASQVKTLDSHTPICSATSRWSIFRPGRRSQRSRWTWKRFLERLGVPLPAVEILHPHPAARFYATHPR